MIKLDITGAPLHSVYEDRTLLCVFSKLPLMEKRVCVNKKLISKVQRIPIRHFRDQIPHRPHDIHCIKRRQNTGAHTSRMVLTQNLWYHTWIYAKDVTVPILSLEHGPTNKAAGNIPDTAMPPATLSVHTIPTTHQTSSSNHAKCEKEKYRVMSNNKHRPKNNRFRPHWYQLMIRTMIL